MFGLFKKKPPQAVPQRPAPGTRRTEAPSADRQAQGIREPPPAEPPPAEPPPAEPTTEDRTEPAVAAVAAAAEGVEAVEVVEGEVVEVEVVAPEPAPPMEPLPATASSHDELGEILAPIVAQHGQKLARETSQRQLTAVSDELEGLFPHLRAAPSAWHSLNAPEVLQAIVDAATDLSAFISELWPTPPMGVRPPEARLGEPVEPPGERVDIANLEAELDGILFELHAMRETLIESSLLADLAAESDQEARKDVGAEVVRLCGGLTTLVQLCIDALAQVPPAAEPDGEQSGEPVPTPTAPAALVALSPSAASAGPAPPGPAASTGEPERTPPAAPSAGEETGLGPAPSTQAPARGPVRPADLSRCEQDLRFLQDFFNDNSPESTLQKMHEEEFARLVALLVSLALPAGGLPPSEQARRINQLRHTLALRKKLKNNLTLTEFKALFAKRK